MNRRTIVIISFVLFLAGWTLVFRLGADDVLPAGFWKILVLILLLDVIQSLFLAFRFLKRPRLAEALLFFTGGMLLLAWILQGCKIIWPWELICGLAGAIYSIPFTLFNRWLLNPGCHGHLQ